MERIAEARWYAGRYAERMLIDVILEPGADADTERDLSLGRAVVRSCG